MENNYIKETIRKNITTIFTDSKYGEVFVIKNIFEFFDFKYSIEQDVIDKNKYIANVSIRSEQQKAFLDTIDYGEDISFVKGKDTTKEELVENVTDYIYSKYSEFKKHIEAENQYLNEELDRIVAEKLDMEEEWDNIFDEIYECFQNSGFDFDSEDEDEDEYDVWSEIWKDVFIKMIEDRKQANE